MLGASHDPTAVEGRCVDGGCRHALPGVATSVPFQCKTRKSRGSYSRSSRPSPDRRGLFPLDAGNIAALNPHGPESRLNYLVSPLRVLATKPEAPMSNTLAIRELV